MKTRTQVRWTYLYGLLLLGVIALFGEARLRLTPLEHKLALTGIVLGFYALLHWWVRSNAPALDENHPLEHLRDPQPAYDAPALTPTQQRYITALEQQATPEVEEPTSEGAPRHATLS